MINMVFQEQSGAFRIMEHRWQYPSVSQKIQRQPYLFLRHFRGCSYSVMQSTTRASGAYVNWREEGALLPAFPGKESSPVPITIGAPVEKTRFPLHDLVRSAIITTAVAPIERVKLLLQCQNMIINSGRLSQPYKGILDCFSTIIRNEGFFALWRGNFAKLTAHSQKVLKLGFSISLGYENTKVVDISALLLTAKYAFAGAASGLFVYPLYYAETRLTNDVQTTSGARQFNGIVDVYRKTLISDGIGGLYRGFSLSLVRVTLFPTIQAVIFLALKPWFLSYQSNLVPAVWIQAFAALTFTTMALYPTGTVCRRMMMCSGEAVKYESPLDAISQILRKEGVRSFYKGGGAEIMKLTVSTGLLLAIFLPARRRVAAEKKKTNESGRPACTIVNLKWSNLGDGSHDSDR